MTAQFAGAPAVIRSANCTSPPTTRARTRRPAFARAYFIGLPVAGEPAVAQRERGYERFRAVFREIANRAREEQPGLPPAPEIVSRVLVLAITELVAEEVRAGRTEQLRELEPEIVTIAAKLLADDRTAELLV